MHTIFKKYSTLLRKFSYKQWAIVAVVVVIISVILILGRSKGDSTLHAVISANVTQTVSVSGETKSSSYVDLAFEQAGTVAGVVAKVGAKVGLGQTLVYQDYDLLQSRLDVALADLSSAKSEMGNTLVNLDNVVSEQNVLVANARRNLLSVGLVAVPENGDYDVTAPSISGIYDGPEGVYKIRVIENENTKKELRVFGLELNTPVEILENEPTKLGTRGLYISFADDLDAYSDTIWYVTIPNTKTSVYVSNYNSYQSVLTARDLAISKAKAELEKGTSETTIAEANVTKAQAEVDKIRKEIENRILRAPISGVVTKQEAKVGESVTAGEVLVSILNPDSFEVEANIPEINIGKIKVGQKSTITLDAFPGENFSGEVFYIDPAETLIDGVVNYKIKVSFTEKDERLKNGLTANLSIITDSKDQVVAVPVYAITTDKGVSTVKKYINGQVVVTLVKLGIYGDNGLVEVIEGLVAGDKIEVKAQ